MTHFTVNVDICEPVSSSLFVGTLLWFWDFKPLYSQKAPPSLGTFLVLWSNGAYSFEVLVLMNEGMCNLHKKNS